MSFQIETLFLVASAAILGAFVALQARDDRAKPGDRKPRVRRRGERESDKPVAVSRGVPSEDDEGDTEMARIAALRVPPPHVERIEAVSPTEGRQTR